MKVERDSNVKIYPPAYRASAPSHRPAGSGESAAVGDQVTVSAEARQAAATREKLAAEPQVRRALIERIKAQLAQGTYNVSGHAVADKILKAKVLEE
ncbi:MAG: flagellar biosynthesis anti-sigma factor FlgM [Mycobacterium leprae]